MIEVVPDNKLNCQIIKARSPHEMVEIACNTASPEVRLYSYENNSWMGRGFSGWEDVRQKFASPWEAGLKKVALMMDRIKQEVTLTPKDIRRKMRFDETEGEIDIDRCLGGEAGFYRKPSRTTRVSTRNVGLIANIGNIGSFNADQIFWRGIAACVIIDILEEAGYRCELWMYNTAYDAFPRRYPSKAFISVPVKQCEDSLNLELVCNCLSAWFHRAVVFGYRASIPGYAVKTCSSRPELGELKSHINMTHGIQSVEITATAYSEVAAVVAVNNALEAVTNGQGDNALSIYNR